MQRVKAPGNAARTAAGAGGSFRIPQVPVEWLDASAWRLPSGKALAEFALQAGFLAPLLLGAGSPAWLARRARPGRAPAAARGVR